MPEETPNSEAEVKDEQEVADKIMDGNAVKPVVKAGEEQAPSTEDKPAEEAKPAEEKPAEEKPKEIVYDIKLPEGSQLPEGQLERTVAFAKAQGLSKEAAQSMLDQQNELLASNAESQKEAWTKETEAWVKVAKEDKETGGEEFGKNAELAKRVIDRFGTKELKEGLTATGFGNHPELFRFVTRIGKAMSDDKLVVPGAQTPAETKDMADLFYGQSATK